MRSRFYLLIVGSLIPLALGMIGFLLLNLAQERQRVQTSVSSRSELISGAIAREFEAQIDFLRVLAQTPILDVEAPNAAAFRDLAIRFKDQLPLWNRIILSDAASGKVLVNTGKPPETYLGTVVDIDAQRRAIETEHGVIGNVVGPGPSGQTQASFKVPVIRDGRVRFVLTATTRMDRLAALVRSHDAGTLSPVLVDGLGRVAFGPDGTASMGRAADPVALAARATASAGAYRSADGSFTAYRSIGNSGWSVYLTASGATLDAAIYEKAGILGALGLAALSLSVSFIVLLRREMQRDRAGREIQEQAARMAALGRLTGGVAHDFNNLLMVISGSAEMLGRRIAPEHLRLVDMIQGAAERAARITRSLLAFSRETSGDIDTVDVGERVLALVPLLRQAAGTRVTLAVEATDEAFAHLSPVQLEMALLNLVVNARDAMPEGGRVALCVAVEKGVDPSVVIRVDDEGAGISEDVLPHVFEPFFTTKAVGQGTGIGLSQVYGFARSAAGQVSISSVVGKGTSVVIRLPLSARPVARTEAIPAEARAAPPETGRALVVDDNAEVLALTTGFLEEQGWKVVRANDAGTALDAWEKDCFDLIVSDIVMPGPLNGVDLVTKLQAERPATRAVLVSGYKEAVEFPADMKARFVRKPFTPSELLRAVEQTAVP